METLATSKHKTGRFRHRMLATHTSRFGMQITILLVLVAGFGIVSVRAELADPCGQGFVWRAGFPNGHECTAPAPHAARNSMLRLADSSPAAPNPLAGLGNSTLLIIAPEEFLDALQPLVQHKNSTGMPANAVSIAQLTASFPGADDPEKIKRGIQYAYEHLSTQYVMLVGDAQWFPTRYLYMRKLSRYYPNHPRPPSLPVDGVYIPSDLFYASLYHHQINRSQGVDVKPGPFDDWDADKNGYYNEATWLDPDNPNPDRVDGYPDVVVARVPAHNAADLSGYVNKIIRYETQRPDHLLFTFVADQRYNNSTGISESLLKKSRLKAHSEFLFINNPDANAPSNWVNASSEDVAKRINTSIWVSYIGHGSVHGWDGSDFGNKLVKQTAENDALPVIFSSGCLTGRFAIEAPFDNEYADTSGVHHSFVPAPGADPDNPSIPAMVDKVSGQGWGAKCQGCNPVPLVAPKPNPYDFDRGGNLNFSYPWLIRYPQGGAIAYFGEIGVMESWIGAEFETYMLAAYQSGERVLGSIYGQGARDYWRHHLGDSGATDFHSISRLYLGFLVFFGDPSLRVH
jgi:Peptidase family C25